MHKVDAQTKRRCTQMNTNTTIKSSKSAWGFIRLGKRLVLPTIHRILKSNSIWLSKHMSRMAFIHDLWVDNDFMRDRKMNGKSTFWRGRPPSKWSAFQVETHHLTHRATSSPKPNVCTFVSCRVCLFVFWPYFVWGGLIGLWAVRWFAVSLP